MEIKYQIFETDNLFIQKFIGQFSVEHYMRFNGYIGKLLSSSSINKVLIDFRDLIFSENNETTPVDFDEKLNKIVKIRKNINQEVHKNKRVNLVIWVDKPLPTVIAHLFVKKFSEMDYKYCSSDLKAIEILNIPTYNNLENTIKNLENTF